MKRMLCILIACLCVSQAWAQDLITKKDGVKIKGRVVKSANQAYAVRTVEGNLVVVKMDDIATIKRGNMLLDLEHQIKFRVEKQRPFLPFLILTGASTAYSVYQFNEYKKNKKAADDALAGLTDTTEDEYINLKDKSKRNLAMCIASGFVGVGTAYIALKPVEVRTPLGPLKLSLGVQGSQVQLAVRF